VKLGRILRTTTVALCCAVMIALTVGCGSAGTATEPLSPAAYAKAMGDWFDTNWLANVEEGKQVAFEDPDHPTQAEIQDIQEFTDKMRPSVAELQAIIPPEEIARVHRQFLSDWSEQLRLIQEMVDAAKAGDLTAMDDAATRAKEVIEGDANTLDALAAYCEAHSAD
jgi:hypothetical protein